MADNTTFQSSLTATPPKGLIVAGDDISGILYQRMKLIFGGDGVNSGDVSATNPFPIREKVPPYTLYYYDGSGNIEYICSHAVHGTATSATDWEITKFAYDGSSRVSSRQTLEGSVTGRAALGWV